MISRAAPLAGGKGEQAPRAAFTSARRLARRLTPWSIRRWKGRTTPWLIAVQQVGDPLQHRWTDECRLVLTPGELNRRRVTFVADPFALHVDNTWFLFFEQMRRGTSRAEIAMATSSDSQSWDYRGVVLSEPFHLSYPYVFESDGAFYLVPEATDSGTVRIYRSRDLADGRWDLVGALLEGATFKDSTIVMHDGLYYLFTETSRGTNDELRLFWAEKLLGSWREHPASPVVTNNADAARPGGRPIHLDGRLVRFAQRCSRRYGEGLAAYAITQLTPATYTEEPLMDWVLAGSGNGWNAAAMHHLDAHRDNNGWVVFADGHR